MRRGTLLLAMLVIAFITLTGCESHAPVNSEANVYRVIVNSNVSDAFATISTVGFNPDHTVRLIQVGSGLTGQKISFETGQGVAPVYYVSATKAGYTVDGAVLVEDSLNFSTPFTLELNLRRLDSLVPQPTISFDASAQSIKQTGPSSFVMDLGDTLFIRLKVANATKVQFALGGTADGGTFTLVPTEGSRTYPAVAFGDGGMAVGSVSILTRPK